MVLLLAVLRALRRQARRLLERREELLEILITELLLQLLLLACGVAVVALIIKSTGGAGRRSAEIWLLKGLRQVRLRQETKCGPLQHLRLRQLVLDADADLLLKIFKLLRAVAASAHWQALLRWQSTYRQKTL